MKKKWANRLISVLLVPCLLTGPASPMAQVNLTWPNSERNIVTTLSDAATEPEATAPDSTEPTAPTEQVPAELAIASIQRSSDGWTPSATYTITLSGDLSNIVAVTLTGTDAEPVLLESTGDGIYSVTIDTAGTYTVTITQNEADPIAAEILEDKIDAELPTITLDSMPDGEWAKTAVYTFLANDDFSQVESVIVRAAEGDEYPLTEGEAGNYSFTASKNGSYTAIVKDKAGNEASLPFEVSNIDPDAPVISNPVRSVEGWAKDVVYTFTAVDFSSGIAAVTVQPTGGEVTELIAAGDGTYSFTADANTTYTISVTDLVGNSMQITVTDNSIDREAPLISAVKRETSGWAQQAIYYFTCTDASSGIATVQVQAPDGSTITLTADESGTYRYAADCNGSYTIIAIDAVGNASKTDFTVDQIDTTAPEISNVTREQDGWQQKAEYTFTAADSATSIASVSIRLADGTFITLTADENGVYRYTVVTNGSYVLSATDAAGNVTEYPFTEDHIDRVNPEISDLIRQESGWTQEVDCTFTVTDTASGIASVTLAVNGTTTSLTAGANNQYHFTISNNGTYTITVVDQAGNATSATHTENQIDYTAPAISEVKRRTEGWAQEAVYTFTVTDTGSGVAAVTVQLSQDEQLTLTPDALGNYFFTASANQEYMITATDAIGNSATTSFTASDIDTVVPVVSGLIRETEGWAQEAEYTFSVMDDLSGIASVTIRSSSGKEIGAIANGGNYQFTVIENTTFTITVTDAAGNVTEVTFEETLIDRVAPSLKVIGRIQESWQQAADHVFTVEDIASGIQTVKVLFDGKEISVKKVGDGSYRFTAAANGIYTIIVTDMVGNEISQTVTEDHIDLTAPVISDINPQQSWDSTANSVTMRVTDDCELASVTVVDVYGNACAFIQNGSSFSLTLTENGVYTVTAVDAAGNAAKQTFTVDHIDTQAPTAPELSANGTGFWVNVDVKLNAISSDTQSGVVEYWYSTDTKPYPEGNWEKMSFDNGNGTLVLTDDMDLVYSVVAIDAVGRVSAATEIRVQIDKTPAETVAMDHILDSGSGYLRQVEDLRLFVDKITFSADASDSASGVVRYEYKVLGASGSDTGWISVDAGSEGIIETFRGVEDHYTIYLRVYDLAGNCTPEYVAATCILENSHIVDTQRNPMPGVEIVTEDGVYDGAWTQDTITVTVSGSSSVSAIEYYEYRIDHVDPAIADLDWTRIALTDGNAKITADRDTNAVYYFRAVSYAGNTSMENTAQIHIQKSAPAAATLTPDAATGTNGWYTVLPNYAVTLPSQNAYFAPVQYLISFTHNGSQQTDVVYDGTNAPQISADGLWRFQITTIDAAGNTATADYSVVNFSVDTKAPSKLDVTMDGSSILNSGSAENSAWDNVVIENRVLHSDFTIFKTNSVTVKAVADGGDSGLAALYYQVAAEAEDYNGSRNWTLLAADGLHLDPDSKNHLYFKAVDVAGNITYFSGSSILLDATAPGTGVSFSDVNCSVHGFYNGNVTVDLRVEEPITGTERVFAGLNNVQYRVLCDGNLTQQGQLWPGSGMTTKEQERVLAWNGSFVVTGELNNSNNVVVEIIVTDEAGNTFTHTTADGELRIDMTAPEISGSYDRNDPVVTFQEQGCFTGDRTLTISVTELNFIPEESFIHVLETDTGKEEFYSWTSAGNIHTAVIPITADGHYTVTASITDAAGNVTQQILFAEGTVAADAFVLDNTPSDIRVSYNNLDVHNGMYFNSARTLTVTITERNFDPAKISAFVYFTAENGVEMPTKLTQWQSDGNSHVATIVCNTDGIYRIEVTGTDALDNPANPTDYTGTASERWVLDTYFNDPTLDYVVNGQAYNGEIVPQVTVLDANIDSISITLMRTKLNEIDVDVTDLLLTPDKLVYQDVDGGKTLGLDIFPLEQGMDGQYTLTVNCIDLAGNTSSNTVMFYANRFGSVYAYSDYLVSLMNGYFQEITEDIVITEYNPSGVIDGSSTVQITVDGVPVTKPAFEVTGTPTGEQGESGWFEYTYTIPSENFAQDGVYSVVVSSKDTAGNIPENTADALAISFAVDTTAPTLPLITGLENAIVKADSVEVTLSAMDNVMLSSITVYLNGEILNSWTDINSYSGEWKFKVPAGLEQNIRIVVVDMTGNTLDTDADSFAPGYGFNRTITVSTNFFLRLYANRPLFIGVVIGASVLLVGGLILIILLLKKRKSKKKV